MNISTYDPQPTIKAVQSDAANDPAARAERITEDIRTEVRTTRESVVRLLALIEEARKGEVHLALGLRSWTEYMEHVFKGCEPIVLSMPDRRRLVAQLSEMGMTTRAIAPIVGVGQMTVVRDQGSTESSDSVDLTGRNGKTYKRSPRQDKPGTTAPDEGDEALVTPDTIGRTGEAYAQNSRAWSGERKRKSQTAADVKTVERAVYRLEGYRITLNSIDDLTGVDPDEASDMASKLREQIKSLRRIAVLLEGVCG